MSSGSDDESYILSAERKAKQNYLFEEIIENYYDPELFTLFCSKTKTPDLDYWTFDELQECVSKFKQKYRRGQTLQEVLNQEAKTNPREKQEKSPNHSVDPIDMTFHSTNPTLKNAELAETDTITPQLTITNSSNPEPKSSEDPKEAEEITEQDSKYSIKCIKYRPTSLNNIKNLEFKVINAELVEGGFLSSNYYLYIIRTSPLNWECRRKYTDFLLLQETICAQFPGHFIPPLPENKTIGKPESEIWPKRQKLITHFLFWVRKSQTILSHPFIEQFFKIPSQPEFIKFSKTQKKTKIESLEKCFSETGQLTCDLSDLSGKIENFSRFLAGSESVEKRLKAQAAVILKNLKNVEEDFCVLSKNMESLKGCTEIFKPFEKCGKAFGVLENGFSNRAETEKMFYGNVKEHLKDYFGYRTMEKQSLKELIKAQETSWSDYKKAEVKQKSTEKVKALYGFYNYQAHGEVARVLGEENSILRGNFSEFGKKCAEMVTRQHGIWGDLQSSLRKLKI